MAQFEKVEALVRMRAGKGAARATRRAGRVPAVVYGGGQEPLLISLDPRFVVQEMHRGGWRSRLFELQADKKPVRVLMREIQLHPVTDMPEHVDFLRLAAGHKVRVNVSVHFLNEETCPGIKRGGVLNVVRHTIELLCDADSIPERIDIDLAERNIGDAIRMSDLVISGTAQNTAEGDFVVATVAPPTKMVETAAPEAEAEAAAPAAKS